MDRPAPRLLTGPVRSSRGVVVVRVVVFGATGSVGRLVVQGALEDGHAVTAFTREASRVPRGDARLAVVTGDVLDADAVRAAVEGQDAVVVVLGDGRAGAVRAEGTAHVVRAMRETGVRRLVVQSTLGVGDSRANLDFVWRRLMFGLLLRKAYADHVRQEDVVRGSGLDWTIVRPSAFTDGPATGAYRRGFGPHEQGLALKVSRADVAAFVVEQLTSAEYLHRAAAVSS